MNKGIIIFIIYLFLISPSVVKAGIVEDLSQQIQAQEIKRAELEKQAQIYQNFINQKQGEIKTLNNQVYIFNAQIGKLQVEINITEDKTSQTNLEILQLEYGLSETEKDAEKQKINLAQIIQGISEYDEVTDLEIVLKSDNFSDFFDQVNYLENLQSGVQQRVENLKLLKNKIIADKDKKEEKRKELEILKNKLADQTQSLNKEKKNKESLLSYTRGEENKYQAMLKNIEEQKKSLLGDINRLRLQKAAELARLEQLQEIPAKEYWASVNWYYRQDDPRWGKTTIGFSNSLMEDYGCAITSVAMALTKLGQYITPGQLAKEKIFSYDLIIWPQKWNDVELTYKTYRGALDWLKVDSEIKANNPVIVRIQADGKNGGHYVIIHHKTKDGRYVVHDPLFGANIYLDSSRVYISNLYDTTTSVNQMIVYH